MSVTTVRDLTINTWGQGFTFGAQRTLPAGTRGTVISRHGSSVVIDAGPEGMIAMNADDVR